DVEIKTAQLKGKDDMLNGIYYYHPSVDSIQKYANLLRKDLELSPINDKNDFLDQRVINHYGSLIPLTPLDSSLLRKEQNDTTDKDKSSNNTDDSNNNNSVNNQQQPATDQNLNQNQSGTQQTPQASNNQNGVVN
ncbi:TPA: polyisoprenyl-teichoic acid--peptidoglycan teichoic acid transferase, partial [Staphylococcus aureus]